MCVCVQVLNRLVREVLDEMRRVLRENVRHVSVYACTVYVFVPHCMDVTCPLHIFTFSRSTGSDIEYLP